MSFASALPKLLMVWGFFVLAFSYGYAAHRMNLFPAPQIDAGLALWAQLKRHLSGDPPPYFARTRAQTAVRTYRPTEVAPGLTLVAGVAPDRSLFPALNAPDGRTAHRWDLDWYRIWPDAKHVLPEFQPKERPGSDIQGLVLSPNGDLTFSYGYLGLVQVNICGRVKWRLAYPAHHAVDLAESGNFWILGHRIHRSPNPELPNFWPPFREDEILEVSPTGFILQRIPIFNLFKENGLQGLIYVSTTESTAMGGDVLHVNDVKVVPSSLPAGLLRPGDVMFSARNVNAVFVFNPTDRKIKQMVAGRFVRHHDPDFVDGDTISVLDNNNVGRPQAQGSSRVVEYSFRTGELAVKFQGSAKTPFYTDTMGDHQRLGNGNMLLTESTQGRALEVNVRGEPVWEYVNLVGDGLAGVLDEAQRIAPEKLDLATLRTLATRCTD
jgi:hypothetical protein